MGSLPTLRSGRAATCSTAATTCRGLAAETCAPAAALTFVTISRLSDAALTGAPSVYFRTKSTAPSSSARSVVAAARRLMPLITTTGTVAAQPTSRSSSRPSPPGICRSSVSTSGTDVRTRSSVVAASWAIADDAAVAVLLEVRRQQLAGERRVVGDGDADHEATFLSAWRLAWISRPMRSMSASSWNGLTT